MVRGQSMGLRASLHPRYPLRSVTCTRVLRLAVSASSGPPFPDACHGKIALASSSWNRWDSWRGGGLIAFDRGLMGVLVRGEERCGHRLLISDIELGYSWKIVRKCFVRWEIIWRFRIEMIIRVFEESWGKIFWKNFKETGWWNNLRLVVD